LIYFNHIRAARCSLAAIFAPRSTWAIHAGSSPLEKRRRSIRQRLSRQAALKADGTSLTTQSHCRPMMTDQSVTIP
jgi:hypothetical protein